MTTEVPGTNYSTAVGLPDAWLPYLRAAARQSQLLKWVKYMVTPHMPIDCVAVRRRGIGGSRLKKTRFIRKWFKARPHMLFPKGAVSKKMLRVHREVNYMYYSSGVDRVEEN